MPESRPTMAIVVPWSPEHAGGVNTVVKALYQQATDDPAVSPLVLVNSWDHANPVSGTIAGMRVVHARIAPAPRTLLAVGKYAWWWLRYGFRLALYLRRHGVCAVNVHYPSSDSLFFTLCAWLGLVRSRIVLSYHGLDVTSGCRTTGMERWLYEWTMRRADALTSCSLALRERLAACFTRLDERPIVIHNGTQVTPLKPAAITEKCHHPALQIACIGTYEEKKGQDVLLRAFARVCEQRDARLTLVGRAAPFLQTLRRLAVTLGVQQRVDFFVDLDHPEAMRLLAGADVFVCPSREEPFGIVLLEAGALGVPVVASAVGGIPEFIVDRRNGLLVPADDVDRLAAAIRELIDTPTLRSTLANALHADVLRRHTWPAVWAQYRAVLVPG